MSITYHIRLDLTEGAAGSYRQPAMCNAYTLRTRLTFVAEAVERQLGIPLVFSDGITAATTNLIVPETVYPRRDGLILIPKNSEKPLDGLKATLAHWNLTPFFHKGGLKAWKASTNNARSETMATSPAFRDAYKRRRCIIPATSFTEWTGPKGSKTAHAISRRDGGMLFFAGLWDRCPEGEGYALSYTMPMIDAVPGDDAAPFHNRQPVILERASASIWLDLSSDPKPILTAPPGGTLGAMPPNPGVPAPV